eukprot:11199732-Lingulodinium_polyedra.AAC.1
MATLQPQQHGAWFAISCPRQLRWRDTMKLKRQGLLSAVGCKVLRLECAFRPHGAKQFEFASVVLT